MDPADPERRGLPTGPHPTAGPGTVRMPRWPGPTLVVVGVLLVLGSLTAAGLVERGMLAIGDRAILLLVLLAGGIAFVVGLVYAAVRQLRVRRHLPPERYRGPAIFLLLVLVLIVAGLMTAPFSEDAQALLLGDGELSNLGAAVLLVSTQVAMLAVAWAFVFRPNALAGWPSWAGPNPVGALGAGVRWGLLAWLVATVVGAIVVLLLEQIGIRPEPQAAEQALLVIDPWLAVVAIVVLAPIAEELFFRGVVFNAWLREAGTRHAFIGSSLLFAVIHLSVAVVVPIFLLGLALAWIYRRTGNLLAPIAMHATVNGISVALALLVRFEVVPMPLPF